MIGDVLWLLRFARPATRRLGISVAARLVGHIGIAAALALPAWAIGSLAIQPVLHSTAAGGPGGGAADRHGWGFVLAVLLAFAVISLVKSVCRYIEQLYGHLAAFGLMGDMRVWIVDRLIPQAPAVTDGTGAARLHTVAVRDVDRVEVFFAHTIAPAISAVLIPLGAVGVAWAAAGPAVAAVLAVVLALGILLPLLGARRSLDAARGLATARADLSQHVADTARVREDILAAQAEQQRLDSLDALGAQLGGVLMRGGVKSGLRHAFSQLRVWWGAGAVLLIGLLTIPDILDLPGLLIAVALVPGTVASLDTVERLATSLPAGLAATARIRALAAGAPAVTEPQTPVDPTVPDQAPQVSDDTARARMESVHFTYPGRSEAVLRGVDLNLRPGTMVGVVGATGSGKSTLARLLQRHFDPDGLVEIDGVPAPQLGSARVARRVAVADQEPFLLDGTVEENLRLADPEAEEATLLRALEAAACDLRLDRAVGRRGSALSGGQRQRLALARTLVRSRLCEEPTEATVPTRETGPARETGPTGHAEPAQETTRPTPEPPAILVLDEATSHQDPLTQARMVRSLRALGATTLVIAHRLDVLREADEILVLEAGEVVERGDWDELASRQGAFRALLEAQERS